MKLLTQQQIMADKQYQHNLQLEQVREQRWENKQQQRDVEDQQARFFQLQQEEQALYQESLAAVEPEEQAFFDECQTESRALSQEALQALEDDLEQLQQEARLLAEKETSLFNERPALLQTGGKAVSDGT